jgi:monofunctional biosynthetic peptidoglycan transglycosylase
MVWLAYGLGACLLLQLFFVLRMASMLAIDPASTAFQRTEWWRLASSTRSPHWQQHWTPYTQIAGHLKRAVIVSEDDGFVRHNGVQWSALEAAWSKNERAKQRAEQLAARRHSNAAAQAAPKVVGGSTITQQLAKNLFLSSERTLWRKAQEMLLTVALELILDKRRILEIYLNSVEWGEGIFGAEAAARHYFHKTAAQLNADEAAQLAVMLPRPKYFQKHLDSAYLAARSEVIMARMERAVLP